MSSYNWVRQVLSARWILAVVAAICMLILVIAYVVFGPERSIDGAAISSIITAVFLSYFNKKKHSDESDGKE